MAIVKKEIEFAKELDDVLMLVVALIDDIKQKKNVSNLMDELVTAIAGIEQIPDEVKANLGAVVATVGYRVGTIAEVLMAPAPTA